MPSNPLALASFLPVAAACLALALAPLPPVWQAAAQTPRIAANGKIAFDVSELGLASGIGIVNPDGSDLKEIAPITHIGAPAWSPDGKKIAFINNGTLHVVNADGSGLTNLGHPGSYPDWLPDGSRIVFLLQTSGLFEVNPDGSDLRSLFYSPFVYGLDISPDGTRIALGHSDSGIWINKYPSGENVGGVRAGVFDASPTWSPDGSKIAFSSWQQSHGEIWIANADGSDPRPLIPNHPCLWSPTPMPGPSGCASDHTPAWSPDGKQIAFSRQSTDTDIYVVNVDGSEERQVTFTDARESDLDWQLIPDGETPAPAPEDPEASPQPSGEPDACLVPSSPASGMASPAAAPDAAPTVTVSPEPSAPPSQSPQITPPPYESPVTASPAEELLPPSPAVVVEAVPSPLTTENGFDTPESTPVPQDECVEAGGESGAEVTAQAVGLVVLGALVVGSAVALPFAAARRRHV